MKWMEKAGRSKQLLVAILGIVSHIWPVMAACVHAVVAS